MGNGKSHGKSHGKCIEWYKNGQKHYECGYVNGKLHGKCIKWHENGQKTQNVNISMGYLLTNICFIIKN